MGLIMLPVHARCAEPPAELGPILYRNFCTQCHGAQGEGNGLLQAPSIAGLPAWYVRAQVLNFKEGRRGTDSSQPHAMLMASIAKVLTSEHIEAVADTVARLKPVPPATEKKPSAATLAQGRLLYEERCMECHRYNGTGEIVFGSAPLLGLQEWYLSGQLRKFKNGQRGTVITDTNGAKMVAAAQHIESEQALLAVVAYILTLNGSGSPFDTAR